ncbi:cwf18 pre-mRNA splicing factor-domain-containing protein [Hypoxylon fragiforme]|uniref:cwf18 pre-mRNA splicing factor-domain-containing protein n=1 Tax=Hypoxylon fragiforme TaxID=63214 RepID=UPI0020C5BA31|nr:cwf18 pre-mRNA splicing factor-domain-containing protein [Hypoxylon fragiforme]KAI2605859.1 cwf18 pre-mRNA splicing factor-domain-containing protein [Hypoxylon fragiforme]
MSTSQAALSAAADDRKARLAKLKSLKRKQPADEIAPPESDRLASPSATPAPEPSAETEVESIARLHLSGRNYDAETKGPKLGFEAPPTLTMEGPTLEEQAAEMEAEIKRKAAEDAKDDKGIDLFKLQPKKPNWDLKRDLDKKLEVLNVRTDNAIAKLVRERITGAQAAAAKKTAKPIAENENDDEGGRVEAAGMDGVALVEGLRVREREEEEEERKEREEEEEDAI